jgi:glycerol-3-phosphate dehydrogenase (NAD(P)+)
MGTLCALILAERGLRVTLWGGSAERVDALRRDGENKRYLSGHPLPSAIQPTHLPAAAFEAPELIISAVPCQYMRPVWRELAPHVPVDPPIITVAKGIEIDTLLLPMAILTDCLGERPVGCLSGPSIASEVAERKPATVVAASADWSVADLVQSVMSTPYFRVYTSGDPVGVELAGAVKNVIALAAGICDGIEGGCNAKASLVARGLVELVRLGEAMGAWAETFRGLAGVGDLVTTCISPASRNRTAGEKIGRGMSTAAVIESTPSVIEGIPTTKSVLRLAKQRGVELPIVAAVGSVLFDGRSPEDAIRSLMTRPLGPE